MDSFQFLPSSLENLTNRLVLLKSGKQNFKNTMRYLGDTEFTFCKGVYPYSYVSDTTKFDETSLPPIEAFYNSLNEEPLSARDYQRARDVWNCRISTICRTFDNITITT